MRKEEGHTQPLSSQVTELGAKPNLLMLKLSSIARVQYHLHTFHVK